MTPSSHHHVPPLISTQRQPTPFHLYSIVVMPCMQTSCLCRSISRIDLPVGKLFLYIHYREYRRSSNTGRLLKFMDPKRTEVIMSHSKEDEARMMSLIQEHEDDVVVLFPSKTVRSGGSGGIYPSNCGYRWSSIPTHASCIPVVVGGCCSPLPCISSWSDG